MSKDDANNLFYAIKANWSIVIVIVSIIFSWAHFQSSLASQEARLDSVELKASAIDSISGDVKAINAKLDIILKKTNL